MIIVIDGPNKAGKTTLENNVVKELQCIGYSAYIRHWGPLQTDDREYALPLIEDSRNNDIVIWDRSWASEHVYAKLLDRDRRMKDNPFIGEFLHRRAIFGQGMSFILVPSISDGAVSRVDESDLGVDPIKERQLFIDYAVKFKWFGILNHYTEESLVKNTKTVIKFITTRIGGVIRDQRHIVIPPIPRSAIFIGNQTIDPPMIGGWLPFTSTRLFNFASLFGQYALAASWADTNYITAKMLEDYKYVIVTDNSSETRVLELIGLDHRIINLRVPVDGGKYSPSQRDEKIKEMGPSLSWLYIYLRGVFNAAQYL